MDISAKTSLRLAVLAFCLVFFNRFSALSDWAKTQYLFTYDFGLQRRGLVGEVTSWFAPDGITQAALNAVGMLVTLVGCVALLAYMARSVLSVRGGGAVLLMFVTSVGFATLIGNTGYLGGVMMVLAVAALCLPMTIWGVLVRALLCGLGVLVHESMLPIFATLVAAEAYFRAAGMPEVKRIGLASLPLVVSGLCVAVMATLGTHPHEMLEVIQDAAQGRAFDFDIRQNAVEPVVAAGHDGRSYDVVWGSAFYNFRLIAFGGLGLVFLVAQTVLVWQLTRGLPALERVVAVAVGWAPLSLLFVAFDISRFVAFALVNNLLMIGVLCRLRQVCRDQLHSVFAPAVVVIFLVLQGQTELRDLNDRHLFQFSFPGRFVYAFFDQ